MCVFLVGLGIKKLIGPGLFRRLPCYLEGPRVDQLG
jgi:hypothetical protein